MCNLVLLVIEVTSPRILWGCAPSGGWRFIVTRSRRRRPARGALPESGAGRSPLQASPGARRARVCGRSVCWGSKGLRPVTSRPQHRKTAPGWAPGCTKAPGDVSAGRLTSMPRDRRGRGPDGKSTVSLEASSKSPRRQLRCTPCDVCSLYGSHVHHHREDPASRGLWSAYIACASKTRQPRIRDPRLLKPSS